MRNQYSFSEKLKNLSAFILTRIFYKSARLVRRPIYVRGKKMWKYETGLTTGYNCRIEMFPIKGEAVKLMMGKNCRIGDNVHIAAGESIKIGNNCLMASKIYISDITHGIYVGENESSPDVAPMDRELFTRPVSIGDNVWIGENVCILPGSVIGDGCIIGANSVVKGEYGPDSMIVGVPAKIVKKYDNELRKWKSTY